MKVKGEVNVNALFHSFRDGLRILSHGISSSGFQLPVASSILSVAALALALRDGRGRSFKNLISSLSSYSDSKTLPENLWVVPGLQNLGNNCFLNVILQALASCSCFRSSLQRIVEEYEALSEDDQTWDMPLAVSLNTLLQELCIIRHKREALSPRKVMLAMAHYIPNFNLTSQQDAEEALAHMLSSLREEFAACYAPYHNSLAVASNLGSCRILAPEGKYNELERWTHSFLGPFNGIVGSILTCQSCSFQISLDFQFFNCLYLSPPAYGNGSIIPGCSIEDCLKQFFGAERLENYFCSNCWHTAAIKYLSLLNKNETDIEKLCSCSKLDSCDCKNIPHLGGLPWSNSYSRTFKQLRIARNPEILCLNLQRASVTVFGELVKLQGHISFPLMLNMSPFLDSEVDMKLLDSRVEMKHFEQNLPNQQHIHYTNFLRVHVDTKPLNCIYKQGEERNLAEIGIPEETREASSEDYGARETQAIEEEQTGCSSEFSSCTPMHHNSKTMDAKVLYWLSSLYWRPRILMNGPWFKISGGNFSHPSGVVHVSRDYESVTYELVPIEDSGLSAEDCGHDLSGCDLGECFAKLVSPFKLGIASQYLEVHGTRNLVPREHHMYHLVSVVEHFGSTGSGHYTVYRRVSTNLKHVDEATVEASYVHWVGVSDSQVRIVSQEDVLAAEASLLFYERV